MPGIHEAIPRIMAEVGAVEKGRRNQQQGYQFRGIDDVYAAVQLVMAKHGVFAVPRVLEQVWEERQTKSGGAMLHLRSVIRHTFYAADGSSVEADTFGEGMDSGDKASNKAMSAAMKYALVETFAIPTSEPKDPENESPEVLPKKPAAAAPAPAPVKAAAKPAAAPKPREPGADDDDISAPLEAVITNVRGALLNPPPAGMGWVPKHAEAWLKKYFGVARPADMSLAQAADAWLLLTTRMRTPEMYPSRLEQFHSEKRILTAEHSS